MPASKKSNAIQVILGVMGTILVALVVFLTQGVVPGLAVSSARTRQPLFSFLVISAVFFFPPYFAVMGLFGLLTRKTDEVSQQEFMSSYAYTEKSKKDWIKHLAACAVGVINAGLMGTLAAT